MISKKSILSLTLSIGAMFPLTTIFALPPSSTGVAQYAYFNETNTIIQTTGSIAPGNPFLIGDELINTIPTQITSSTNNHGTVYKLEAGTYIISYELSLVEAGSVALHTGTTSNSLTAINQSTAGSIIRGTWIHGNYALHITSATYVSLCPTVRATPANPPGTASNNTVIRILFQKIA